MLKVSNVPEVLSSSSLKQRKAELVYLRLLARHLTPLVFRELPVG